MAAGMADALRKNLLPLLAWREKSAIGKTSALHDFQ
jgi:hypothetical protein